MDIKHMYRFQERVNLAFHALGFLAVDKDKCPLSVSNIAQNLKVLRED